MEASEGSAPLLPKYLWHHRVHEELGEFLYFWRLSFYVYSRDSVRAGLKAALAQWKVRSVAVYELFGPFDLLVRVWLPEGCEPGEFQRSLLDELKPYGMEMCEPFAVDYVVRHWAFKEKRGSDEPGIPAVRELLEDETKIEALESGTLAFPAAKELKEEHLVATPSSKKKGPPGIKFALIVTGIPWEDGTPASGTGLGGPRPKLAVEGHRDFQALVTQVVAEAKSIGDRSLYAGTGFGHFLILGRVAYKNFHDIHSRLVTQLGATRYQDRFQVSSVTMISGQRGLRMLSEHLLHSPFLPTTPSGSPALDLEHLEVGTLVINKRFRIEESLGAGGYGTVYRVFDTLDLGMEWALKLFPAASASAAVRELTMLSKVSGRSKHIVKMVWGDRDQETGWPYLVSEFIEGKTLETYVTGELKGMLTDEESLDVVRQILVGLEAIHPADARIDQLARIADERELTDEEWQQWQQLKADGVIHRDIKPANVMITPDGLVKLIDFNIASPAGAIRETLSNTRSHAPPGGWIDRVWAPRVDLFAVGVILYELLCKGESPYPEDRVELADPAEHRPDLSPAQLDFLRDACTVGTCYAQAVVMRRALESLWGSS